MAKTSLSITGTIRELWSTLGPSTLPDPNHLLGYLDLPHLGQTFWTSRMSSPSNIACKVLR